MCACDRNYSCPRCVELEDVDGKLNSDLLREQDDREEARYGHRSAYMVTKGGEDYAERAYGVSYER